MAACLISVCAAAQGVISVDTKSNVLPDGNVELILTVNLAPQWYMYSTEPVKGGPMATALTSQESPDYSPVGGLENVEEPHVKYDQGFRMEVDYFEGTARFRQIIKPLAEETFAFRGWLEFQTCNGLECTLNEEEISVTVNPSAASVEESIAPPAADTDRAEGGRSFWGFLLIAFLAGLAGVITPCVFPMIPMTVGFLIGGGSTRRAGILKGVIFGLSIMVIYTLLGLIVALFQSTAATDAIGTHWIPNLIFALLFIVFAVSFLGAFEITLPSGLANKADREADKGGYIAAFFVALAMVIVSFSCTGPFRTGLLPALRGAVILPRSDEEAAQVRRLAQHGQGRVRLHHAGLRHEVPLQHRRILRLGHHHPTGLHSLVGSARTAARPVLPRGVPHQPRHSLRGHRLGQAHRGDSLHHLRLLPDSRPVRSPAAEHLGPHPSDGRLHADHFLRGQCTEYRGQYGIRLLYPEKLYRP